MISSSNGLTILDENLPTNTTTINNNQESSIVHNPNNQETLDMSELDEYDDGEEKTIDISPLHNLKSIMDMENVISDKPKQLNVVINIFEGPVDKKELRSFIYINTTDHYLAGVASVYRVLIESGDFNEGYLEFINDSGINIFGIFSNISQQYFEIDNFESVDTYVCYAHSCKSMSFEFRHMDFIEGMIYMILSSNLHVIDDDFEGIQDLVMDGRNRLDTLCYNLGRI